MPNVLLRAITVTRPYIAWSQSLQPLSSMFSFGKIGWTPSMPHGSKLTDRGKQVWYMGIEYGKHFILKTDSGRIEKVLNSYFHTVKKHSDPTYTSSNVYLSYKQNISHTPNKITIGTYPPVQWSHALHYPDSDD